MNNGDKKLYNTTLALAGIFQAAALVRDLAKTGTADSDAFQTSISSIYKIDAADVTSIYGGVQGLRLGFAELIQMLGNDKISSDAYLSRYVISMIHLERKLIKNPEMLSALTRRIKYAVSQANYFSAVHPRVIASLADIYVTTLGKLPFRIQILGQAKFLNQEEVIHKIRALLLAGVRSVVLWRQMGGKRWHLFLWRSRITKMAKRLLTK